MNIPEIEQLQYVWAARGTDPHREDLHPMFLLPGLDCVVAMDGFVLHAVRMDSLSVPECAVRLGDEGELVLQGKADRALEHMRFIEKTSAKNAVFGSITLNVDYLRGALRGLDDGSRVELIMVGAEKGPKMLLALGEVHHQATEALIMAMEPGSPVEPRWELFLGRRG